MLDISHLLVVVGLFSNKVSSSYNNHMFSLCSSLTEEENDGNGDTKRKEEDTMEQAKKVKIEGHA